MVPGARKPGPRDVKPRSDGCASKAERMPGAASDRRSEASAVARAVVRRLIAIGVVARVLGRCGSRVQVLKCGAVWLARVGGRLSARKTAETGAPTSAQRQRREALILPIRDLHTAPETPSRSPGDVSTASWLARRCRSAEEDSIAPRLRGLIASCCALHSHRYAIGFW